MVDDKRIQMNLGLEIASMRSEVQQWIYEAVEMGSVINSDIIKHLKQVDETEGLDEDVINYILNEQEQKPKGRKIILSERKLNKYLDLFSCIYLKWDSLIRSGIYIMIVAQYFVDFIFCCFLGWVWESTY